MTTAGWNVGDVFDHLARRFEPSRPAVMIGKEWLSWGELDERSNRLARRLLERLDPGDKVALYGRNSLGYVVALVALFKARLVHVNVNYRYRSDELHYVLDNTDAAAVLHDLAYADELAGLVQRLPKVRLWLCMDGPADARLPSSLGLDAVVVPRVLGDGTPLHLHRSPDDLFFMCTGGTTGMPKAVMWRHTDLFSNSANRQTGAFKGVPKDFAELDRILDDEPHGSLMVAAPLMHGAGLYLMLFALIYGHRLLLTAGSFDARAVLEQIEEHRVSSFFGIGDAIYKPLLNELEAAASRGAPFQLKAVRLMMSSAAPWSVECKRSLLRHVPGAVMLDAMGSSEAAAFGVSVMTADGVAEAPKVRIGPNTKVFNERLEEVKPGSGEAGFVARGGVLPQGYYKDAEKSAQAFREIHGVRYSVPGDWCEINADGTLKFLGRGNVCINTGGEKVYPQEVELVISDLAGVQDVVVVGVPDDRWGEAVTALVQLAEGADVSEVAVRAWVRARLADYKTPKHVVWVDNMQRGANGKADYRALQRKATEAVALLLQHGRPARVPTGTEG